MLLSLLLSAWIVQLRVDPMDDTTTVQAFSAPLSSGLGSAGLALVNCSSSEGYDAAMFGYALPDGNWVDHDFLNGTKGRARVDDFEFHALDLGGDLTVAIFRPSETLLRQMAAGSTLKLEIPVVNKGKVVYTISLSGAAEALAKIDEVCDDFRLADEKTGTPDRQQE
jgi:hypothetical protein